MELTKREILILNTVFNDGISNEPENCPEVVKLLNKLGGGVIEE